MIANFVGIDQPSDIGSLFWIALAAFCSPLIARLVRGYVPDVVVLLGFGVVLGPHALGLAANTDGVSLLSQLGLGMLFLLAGFELDPKVLRGRSGAIAWITWLISLGCAVAFVVLVAREASTLAAVAIGIAMTSTALGTLLPIVKDRGLLDMPLGRAVLAHGAVGELGPVVAMSILLTSRNVGAAVIVLLLFLAAAVLIALTPRQVADRVPGFARALNELSSGTAQLPMRGVVLLLLALMAIADRFGLDVVLGAFAAGLILRRLVRDSHPDVGESLETLGFGMLIPIFFVVSGIGIDPTAVADNPGLWISFVVIIGIARGVPVWVSERYMGGSVELGHERAQLALYAATGLPIIVAVTNVAVDAELITATLASTLVAAGATTVLLFPLAARLIGPRGGGPTSGST